MRRMALLSPDHPRSRRLPGFLHDQGGATAIEYALLAAVLAIMAIGGLQALMSGAGGLYAALEKVSAAIQVALAR
jgi:Flp pilus assembly pilin Flp